jgi:5-methylcytosine-specific restriction enzyme subunit McrC
MRHLSLFERQDVAIGPAGVLTSEDAEALGRMEPSLPRGTISWGRHSLQFGPFCGVLRAGDVSIELLPKTGASTNHSGVLVAMLHATGLLTSAASEGALGSQRLRLLDRFVLDFCDRVTTRLREGMIARYERQEENLRAVRGRLSIVDQLRANVFDQSRVYCHFDERTVDNQHNRALKFVLQKLRSIAVAASTKGNVTALLHRFDAVRDVALRAADVEALSFDRMTAPWKPVFERAVWLLKQLFPNVRLGDAVGSHLLFNMERLFESYIGGRVRKAWERSITPWFSVGLQSPQVFLAPVDREFRLKPDMAIARSGKVEAIFDTKWKQLGAGSIMSQVSADDVYQMTAYAVRYGAQSVTLVYPTARDSGHFGRSASVRLGVPGGPELRVCEVDIDRLTRGASLPDLLMPTEGHEFDVGVT